MGEYAVTLEILGRSARTGARRGRVHTPHGWFDTPAFMPVGTRGSVKGVFPRDLEATGAQICLGNTYHLLLRPGHESVKALGGLHAFMRWDRPILTDSGGYQAYSMADLNKVSDDGVRFRSIVDGSMIDMTPERSIEIQNALGADIIMAFDDCPPPIGGGGESGGESGEATKGNATSERLDEDGPPPRPHPSRDWGGSVTDPRLVRVLKRDRVRDPLARLKVANERTVRWLERCKKAHARARDQALFGIVQGGTDLEQRSWSAERIGAIDLPGYAIGGVAVGESGDDIRTVVRHTAPLLPEGKPRYLMGVGYERDILAAVLAGVDMFDCVLPTRNARNANAFTPAGQVRLRNAKFALDREVLEPGCDCACCAGGFSRGYLRHLFLAEEMLGPMLVSLHNLRYFQRFMGDIRATIATDDWAGLVRRYPVASPALEGLTEG